MADLPSMELEPISHRVVFSVLLELPCYHLRAEAT